MENPNITMNSENMNNSNNRRPDNDLDPSWSALANIDPDDDAAQVEALREADGASSWYPRKYAVNSQDGFTIPEADMHGTNGVRF